MGFILDPLFFSLELFFQYSFQIDEVISQAQNAKGTLAAQRNLFAEMQGRVKQLSDKFPLVRNVLGITSPLWHIVLFE